MKSNICFNGSILSIDGWHFENLGKVELVKNVHMFIFLAFTVSITALKKY